MQPYSAFFVYMKAWGLVLLAVAVNLGDCRVESNEFRFAWPSTRSISVASQTGSQKCDRMLLTRLAIASDGEPSISVDCKKLSKANQF